MDKVIINEESGRKVKQPFEVHVYPEKDYRNDTQKKM